jgi:hypothetical protein
MSGGWKELHNEELHNFYASQNIIRVMKSMKMRWVGYTYSTNEKDEKYIKDLGLKI